MLPGTPSDPGVVSGRGSPEPGGRRRRSGRPNLRTLGRLAGVGMHDRDAGGTGRCPPAGAGALVDPSRVALALVALLVASAVLVACGGGDDDDDAQAEP